MADKEKRGLVARWLEGKERSEDYARSTLPTNRWALFWDILKGRFGRLMLVNLLVLLTVLPIVLIALWRYVSITAQGIVGPYGSGLGSLIGAYPPDSIAGYAEWTVFQADLFFFALFIPAGILAGVGISGGGYIIRNLIWTEGIFVANDFLRGIRRNFLNVLEAVLIFTLMLFVARTMSNLADWMVAAGSPYAGWLIASKVVGYIFVAFFLLVSLWMISLGISYKQGPWALFRNAVVMTVGTFPQTVFFAALAAGPILLLVLGSGFVLIIGFIFYALIGFSYLLLVWLDYSQWAFDKFVNPTMGYATGRGLYDKDKQSKPSSGGALTESESAAMREYKRMIVAEGKSKLVCRPIKPIDDGVELYRLPDSFSREDLQRLKESKDEMAADAKAYEEEHKNDERYVEYNKQFEELERALQSEDKGKKKKAPRPPKMLNKRN